MIIKSFEHVFTSPGAGIQTGQEHTVDFDFRALYQINPMHLVILKWASIVGLARDAANNNINDTIMMARLIGNFNETRNILVVANPLDDVVITDFDGITFSDRFPFRADPTDMILMPATFSMAFRKGGTNQSGIGDTLTTWISIGYDIQLKNSRF